MSDLGAGWQLGEFGRNGEFPCRVDLREKLGAGVIVGGAVVIGFCGSDALHATAGGGVVGIDAQDIFVLALRVVVFAEIVVAFGRIERAADLVDILGVFVSERRVGADRVVEVAEFAFGFEIVRVLGDHRFEQRAGFGIFADLAVLHRECDAGITEVIDVALAAIGEGRGVRHALDSLRVFVDRLLVVAFRISLATFGKKSIAFGGGVLTAQHFALCKAAVAVAAFTGVGHRHDAWQRACHGHQGNDGATGENGRRFLHNGGWGF